MIILEVQMIFKAIFKIQIQINKVQNLMIEVMQKLVLEEIKM